MDTIRLGIDIGGTFTDFVRYDPQSGALDTFKILSTPKNLDQAVLTGIERVLKGASGVKLEIIHGSTVATNALLERKGARTALIATDGFSDVIEIGRQNRPSLYDLNFTLLPPLVPEGMRLEVDERVDHKGKILQHLNPDQVDEVIHELERLQPQSVAICFLFSFLRPENERALAERLRQAGYFVSVSSEVLPEYREYERMSATVVNAYVSPPLSQYLTSLQSEIDQRFHANHPSLRVMQSNGGTLTPDVAAQLGVQCILSGPAGGIIGSHFIASQVTGASILPIPPGIDPSRRLITFDMGGTSTDVCLLENGPKITTEASIGGLPIHLPMMDIHTIGAGGGSIAKVDFGGALRVGPESAGADPGPACYGKGISPTITDAHLVLGHIPPDYFLGGRMPLDASRANRAIRDLGSQLGLDSGQTAQGMLDVVNSHMERALRLISVERGYDPVDFTLLSFGGAGGLHACELARRLGIRSVLVPPHASVLSALGMLAADVVKDHSRTVMLQGDSPIQILNEFFEPLIDRGLAEVKQEGISEDLITSACYLDLRYKGQSFELTIPYSQDFLDTFHALHQREYGYHRIGAPVEIVTLRVRVRGKVIPPHLQDLPESGFDPSHAMIDARPVGTRTGHRLIPFYRGEMLRPANCIHGPAVVLRPDTTILIPENAIAQVDSFLNLWLELQ